MSDVVPEGWKNTIIGEEISDISDGGTPATTNRNYFGGGIPWININDIQPRINHTRMSLSDLGLQKSSARLWDKGTIILSIGATIGKVGIAMKAVTTKQGICGIVPKPNVSVKYFYYFLVSMKQQLNTLSQGSTIKETRPPTIKKIQMCLPPLPEQKKIASILTSVDEVIENTQKQIDKLQDLKKATMNELLTKGIGHTEFKDSELGMIPKSWEVQFLSNTKNENDHYSFTGGPFGSNLKNCDFTKNGVRIIQLQNIGDGDFLNEYKIYTSSQKADELISCNIYPGDIIISKMGDPVARATIIPDIETRYVMSSDGIRLSINEKKYDLKFILESINHHSTRNQAKVLSIGSTRQRIGLTDIRKLLIRIPQLDEQKKISSVINSIDLKIKKINQKLVKTKLLKKSLMQDLLTGKVRVLVN